MMRSMFSGVSGLKVHQTKMDVIGNNISNVNTVGYKAQRVTFNEVFSQTLQGASAASDDTGRGGINAMQVGLGVNVSSIDLLMTQGAAERTDNPFDLMIQGDGFIVVGDESGQFFTRSGALRVDKDGNLCIPNGMKVQGWRAELNEKTNEYEIIKSEVQDITLAAAQASQPKGTTLASISGNITSTLASGKTEETSVSFYDSLGNYYKAAVTLEKTVDTAGKVSYTPTITKVTDSEGNELCQATTTGTGSSLTVTKTTPAFEFDKTMILEFDKNGKLTAPADGVLKMTPIAAADLSIYNKDANTVTPYSGTIAPIEVNCSGITQYATKSTLISKAVDGNSAGTISGYGIGSDGIITATYTNGDQRTVAQVVLAEFDNPAGLEKAGDNLFQVTPNSGEFDGVGNTGNFNTGCLEMSNVDLSTEFTQMITTQRGFQANSRIITVSDEMLQELTNLKR